MDNWRTVTLTAGYVGIVVIGFTMVNIIPHGVYLGGLIIGNIVWPGPLCCWDFVCGACEGTWEYQDVYLCGQFLANGLS